jgi:hypothetical protein
MAQHQQRRAALAGHQREAAAGGEVELSGLAPDLQHDRAEAGAARGAFGRAQGARRVLGPHQHGAVRRETEIGEAGRMKAAGFDIDKLLPRPDDRSRAGYAQGDAQGEGERRRSVGHGGGIDLVQGRAFDPAAQSRVERRQAQRDARRLCARARIGADLLAQTA